MPRDHWNQHAVQWQHVGPPLRPSRADIDLMVRRTRQFAPPGSSVLLGVTPEIAAMAWPPGTELLAVDRCEGMVRGVWPFVDTPARSVVCGDWFNLPVPDASRVLIVGDGCFTLLDYPLGYRRLLHEAHRSLAAGGVFMMRYFCRPEIAEPAEQVLGDLLDGRIGNFHVLKWRLAMALHGTIEQGVAVADVWQTFDQAVPDRAALAARLGWPRATIDTIDAYRDSPALYTFPTLGEVRAISGELFEELSVDALDYELGERCPLVCYRKPAD